MIQIYVIKIEIEIPSVLVLTSTQQYDIKMSEKFSLKWNDFKSTVSNSFGILREEKDFFDVTLVSDDERQIPAHKLVLSACSDFFKSILRNNSHSHPLLYLSGIHSTNLSLILDYIYQGEVQIYQEHLDSFLEVAQKLKIEGLITGTEDTSDVKQDYEDLNNTEVIFTAQDTEDSEYDEKKVVGVRRKNQPRAERTVAVTLNDYSEADEAIRENLGREDGVFYCKVCNYRSNLKTNLTRHIETHIEGLSYSCSVCHKTFRSRNSLNVHKANYHKF